MTYRIIVTRSASRALHEHLPPAVASAAVEFIFGALADNPHRVGHQLRDELAAHWSARRGEYRVVYRIDDGVVTVTVVHVAHRRDVYRPH